MYYRWQYKVVKEALKFRRVLIVAGPRQCGKTTLAQAIAGSDAIYRTLDNKVFLESALSDPLGFVDHGNELMVIDEIQRAPDLLLAIKENVDAIKNPGRFLLTGSARIQSILGVTESLAGRVRKIRLRPLAYGEIYNHGANFITSAFAESFKTIKPSSEAYSKEKYIHYAIKGGYPEARGLEGREVQRWYKDYLEALIEHDLKEIVNIERQDSMYKLLEVLAAWSSKSIDISSIGRDLSHARSTISSYINALEALYLIERLSPWVKTDYERVVKKGKYFITDTGLMVSILGWSFDNVCFNGEMNGKLVETFVFNQLSAILDAQSEDYKLFYYRDREKREIDFIVENEQGDILGVEVKSGSAVKRDSFKHLRWFKKNMAKDRRFIGIVLYTGEDILPFGENMWAVPMNALWA